ncbi:FGGY-family carbohydrate kinase [Treponema phagedenis]|uniref:Carbohydrate kinase n=2 Tax=Treponema phagedenis TaxID=162 RepID=A0AAE6M7S9_TREPH|nr:FGGY-family carbohydrate kinase [Treponema phagedenis]NVP24533.1 carbohydrate kinase [Treponema phagedenis]QEJ94772.1 carbohydrate kinase [Treponema phagedenis]QEJ97709.1 carbohydrate kinase [Treponema phagedenis]QEK00678.1 carbohydrate kinase [Treponema phagedenis]QEK03276.1 carbohydrate kinase [Treponema phagedenis]
MKTILTVDCGTQSLRAMIFDTAGNVLAGERIAYKPHTTPQPGWAEQDVSVYWEALKTGIARIKNANPEAFAQLAGIGVTTIRASTVLVDKNGKVLRPAIIWLDNRTARGSYHPNRLVRAAFHAAGVYDSIVSVQSRCTINWLRENEPETWNKTWKMFFLSGWFIYQLTGEVCDTVSSMVGYIPFVNKKRNWAKPNSIESKLMPLEEEKRHALVESGSIIGSITKKAAEELGIPEGLPLVGCGSDKACETVGAGVVDSSLASLSFGTTATIEVLSSKYFEYKKLFPAYCGIIPNTWLSELEIYRGYWMISWFKEELCQLECKQAEELGVIPEKILDKFLHASPAGGRGLMLQPYWGASIFDRYAKGSIIGFGDVHERDDLYRAIIEGLAYSLREGLELIEAKGKLQCEKVAASGGASQSDAICQITADILNRNLVRGKTLEASSLGAAIITAAGIGEYPSIQAAVKQMVTQEKEFIPNPENRAIYDGLFEVYKKIYPSLKNIYNGLQRVTNYPEAKKLNS